MCTQKSRHKFARVIVAVAVVHLCQTPAKNTLHAEKPVSDKIVTPATTPALARLIRSTSLAAQVKVAGRIATRQGSLRVVEVVKAVYGCQRGEVLLLNLNVETTAKAIDLQTGAAFYLFAVRQADGTLKPVTEGQGIWPVDRNGHLKEPTLGSIVDKETIQDPHQLSALLQHEFLRHNYQVHLSIDENDLKTYAPGRPLHVHVRLDNTGAISLPVANNIEFEFHHGVEMQQLREDGNKPSGIKVCAQRISHHRELAALVERVRQLVDIIELKPGESGEASFEISKEYRIAAGGEFRIWAEVGGRRSPVKVLKLPRREEAMEVLEHAIEAFDDEGPIKKIARSRRAMQPSMPDVYATDHQQVLDVALADWIRRNDQVKVADAGELALLRSRNLPPGYQLHSPEVAIAVCDVWIQDEKTNPTINLNRGAFVFCGKMIEVEVISIERQKATVKLRQNRRHNLGGSGTTYQLIRQGGRWRIDGDVKVWVS